MKKPLPVKSTQVNLVRFSKAFCRMEIVTLLPMIYQGAERIFIRHSGRKEVDDLVRRVRGAMEQRLWCMASAFKQGKLRGVTGEGWFYCKIK